MSAPNKIKERIDIATLVDRLGLEPDRSGYIHCPAHPDKHASLKLYLGQNKGWYCFSCRAGGSVIDFYMHYMQVSYELAMEDLGDMCGLDRPLSVAEAQRIQRSASNHNRHKQTKALQEQRYKIWLEIKQVLERDYDPDQPYPDELIEACRAIAKSEYLTFGGEGERG